MELSEKIEDWNAHKTVSFAADLVGAAIVSGVADEDIKQAAEFLIESGQARLDW